MTGGQNSAVCYAGQGTDANPTAMVVTSIRRVDPSCARASRSQSQRVRAGSHAERLRMRKQAAGFVVWRGLKLIITDSQGYALILNALL